MTSYYSILDRPVGLLLLIIALFLGIGQIAAFAISLQEKYSRRQMTVCIGHMLVGFLFFVFMLESYDIINFPETLSGPMQSEWLPYHLPWLFYAFLEGLSAVILLLHYREYRKYKTRTVTSDAIRQTIDRLPEGICVSAPDGTVLLSNLKMNDMCQELTGERLSDAERFWTFLETKGEDQNDKRLVHMPQGQVWLFSKGTLTAEGKEYTRTNAVNVTKRYRITEELREKNAHLHDIQRRMKEAAELSGEMFVKQEEFRTRTALHNELGQVLLMGRYYLEHPDSTDTTMVILMTKQMNRFLLGESQFPEQNTEDELQQAIHMAGSIGVAVAFDGKIPSEDQHRCILAAAIQECAANTVKHAAGDKLEVLINEQSRSKDLVITITNSGKPPQGTISESGGLLALRRSVEASGGQMVVQSLPAFTLTLTLINT